jgi:hypothetical protein
MIRRKLPHHKPHHVPHHSEKCIATVWWDSSACGGVCGGVVLNLATKILNLIFFCGGVTSNFSEMLKIITHLSTCQGNYLIIFKSPGKCRSCPTTTVPSGGLR